MDSFDKGFSGVLNFINQFINWEIVGISFAWFMVVFLSAAVLFLLILGIILLLDSNGMGIPTSPMPFRPSRKKKKPDESLLP